MNEGRGTHETFDYVPFSDPKMLSELICNRLKYDRSFVEKMYPSGPLSTCGGIIFNESILAVYVDLDKLIESAPLTARQRAVIGLLMRGYTIQDIAEETGADRSGLSHTFARALRTMASHHIERWRSVVTGEAARKWKEEMQVGEENDKRSSD